MMMVAEENRAGGRRTGDVSRDRFFADSFEAAKKATTPLERPSDEIFADGYEPKPDSILRTGFDGAAPPPAAGNRTQRNNRSAPVSEFTSPISFGTIISQFFELLALLLQGNMDEFGIKSRMYGFDSDQKSDSPVKNVLRENIQEMREHSTKAGSTYEERYAYYYANLFKNNDLMQASMKFLGPKEGFRNFIYRDTQGHLTSGTGHLMTNADYQALGLNKADVERRVGPERTSTNPREKIFIDPKVLDTWRMEDTAKAVNASTAQAAELGIKPDGGTMQQAFIVSLTSVNYQLGTAWNDPDNPKAFDTTWNDIKAGRYDVAINKIENSAWAQQTPDRAMQFVEAIESLKRIRPNGEIAAPAPNVAPANTAGAPTPGA